jgi:hypothetical protein
VPEIYHITHHSNLASIISDGGLFCDRVARGKSCVQIGYQHIKSRRLARNVPLPPGGCVGDYVPFYFAPRSPMLYAIHKGRIEGYTGGESGVVYLVSSAESVDAAGLDWVFTDGHAEMSPLTSFYDDFNDFDKIDWDVLGSTFWNDTDEHPDRKRKRQAEFLVHQFFPWELVRKVGVYGSSAADTVTEVVGAAPHQPEVITERRWYY